MATSNLLEKQSVPDQAIYRRDDTLHPQWVVMDFATTAVDAIRIAWAEPYARRYVVQYWTGEEPIHYPTQGVWQDVSAWRNHDGKGGTETLQSERHSVTVRYLRIWMTESSNTCDTHGSADQRNCVGYAIMNCTWERLPRTENFTT